MASPILVTGAAGFIGYHTSKALLERGESVVGIDNLNSYYDPKLKEARLQALREFPHFSFTKLDVSDYPAMQQFWKHHDGFRQVIHLAAQAGVRYSLQDPFPYITSNVMGFMVILELCRHQDNLQHLIYASTSSIYGANTVLPFEESQRADTPLSLYAATKRSNELMAQSYYHLYQMPIMGLRFFTVYGPWGRPDMSAFKFTHAILNDEPIEIFNNGQMRRDYTYIDDIVQGTLRGLDRPHLSQPGQTHHPIYNLGAQVPEKLMDFIATLEKTLGLTAKKIYLPHQPGDVLETYADITRAQTDLGFQPTTPIDVGIQNFVNWYQSYYN
ncbi:MAG: NAD-dependent epimerase/dehydratase family protein [Alphaproteobacteria bacterium]